MSECPRGNIRISELLNSGGHAYAEIVDLGECTACALCCQMCPEVAIQIGASDGSAHKSGVRIQETGVSKHPSGNRRRELGVRSE